MLEGDSENVSQHYRGLGHSLAEPVHQLSVPAGQVPQGAEAARREHGPCHKQSSLTSSRCHPEIVYRQVRSRMM